MSNLDKLRLIESIHHNLHGSIRRQDEVALKKLSIPELQSLNVAIILGLERAEAAAILMFEKALDEYQAEPIQLRLIPSTGIKT